MNTMNNKTICDASKKLSDSDKNQDLILAYGLGSKFYI